MSGDRTDHASITTECQILWVAKQINQLGAKSLTADNLAVEYLKFLLNRLAPPFTAHVRQGGYLLRDFWGMACPMVTLIFVLIKLHS